MKKLLTLLIVCALAAPLLAADVDFTATDNEDGTCTISMTINADDVVGIGLDVATTAGADLTGVTTPIGTPYDIYIDSAYDMETATAGSYGYGDGQPVCLVNGPGETTVADAMTDAVAGEPSRTFGLCMGFLGGYPTKTATAPAAVTTVELVTLAGDDGATGTIDLNAIRGGVVKGDATAATTNLPITWSISVSGCGCLGDFTGDGVINGLDVDGFIATFNKGEGDPDYNCKGDFTGDGVVNGLDVDGFIAVFNTECPE